MHFSKIVALAMAAVAVQAKSDAEILESHSQIVNVPIDEKRALTLKVSPTYTLDEVNSVTLKSFRKIVGYDTFDSIRRKDRNETKDTSDYYNVTVSMMIRRRPAEAAAAPARDPYAPDGAPSLAATLDKGFPYDDWAIESDRIRVWTQSFIHLVLMADFEGNEDVIPNDN